MVNLRHKECLERCLESLGKAQESCTASVPVDLVSIDVKEAVLALGEITGEVVSEEIINKIFEQFCVGK
ncbi:MAG: hypothetical protein HQ596_05150 [Candidatus Saganbacteria bacterium]|nr:hypothetical protein [Candidatus Saganbacteria bacterium]